MTATLRLLDAVKRHHGVSSDYALAKVLGVGGQILSRYRTGKHTVGDDLALDWARLCGFDECVVLLEVQAERAANGGRERVAETLSEAARRLRSMT